MGVIDIFLCFIFILKYFYFIFNIKACIAFIVKITQFYRERLS